MKNFLVALAMLFTITSFSYAQTAIPSSKTQTTHTKKDGTPDKRYKENKQQDDAVKHKKKDGTPDKRYKENKSSKKN